MSNPVDIFLVYEFIKRLSTPFDKTNAFKLGLIDADGNRLKKAETKEEKAALGYYDRMIFNLKRLLSLVPGGKTQIGSFAAALLLLREKDERYIRDENFLREEYDRTIKTLDMDLYRQYVILEEDVAAVNAGMTTAALPTPVTWVQKPPGLVRRGRPRTMGKPFVYKPRWKVRKWAE